MQRRRAPGAGDDEHQGDEHLWVVKPVTAGMPVASDPMVNQHDSRSLTGSRIRCLTSVPTGWQSAHSEPSKLVVCRSLDVRLSRPSPLCQGRAAARSLRKL
jgi:hypothetical protein